MKAQEQKLLDFLKKSPQFIVPIYQRTYSWTQKECEQLWNDIVRAGSNQNINGHFIGSIVYVEAGLYNVSSQTPLLVIDGQQRLTTMTLLLEALARHLDDSEPIPGFSQEKIRNYYLLNPLESDEQKYKVLLTETDKTTLLAIIQGQEIPKEHSEQVQNNFEYFCKVIENTNKIEAVCEGIAKLIIVDISLDRQQDNPQLIFESLNSTGKELSEADLIRNYILMGLEPETQKRLYENYWRPMEKEFGQEKYKTDFDDFIRHYLTIKTGSIPKQSEIYEEFKFYAVDFGADIETLITDIKKFASYYCAIALGAETNPKLHKAFNDLMILKADVSIPLVLKMYADKSDGLLSDDEFLQAVRWVESYVFRRAICGIPTNSMNKTFASLPKKIETENYLESLKAQFLLLKSYTHYPTDTEFKTALKEKDVYNFRNKHYLLYMLENYKRKEPVSSKEYTIEHILPQNENLSSAWKEELGENWKQIQEQYLHTIGNLTLTGYNSEYSDKPFTEKKSMEGGFDSSPLHLNKSVQREDNWNEFSIVKRADELSDLAIEVWSRPELDDDTLYKYRPQEVTVTSYSIENHKFLQEGKVNDLFEKIRKEILALDPNVKEEFLSRYVAYKADTNFVDIKGRSDSLALFININIQNADDPLGLCIDKSSVGHSGNGDTLFVLRSEDEIKYAVSIIQQALDVQIG